MGIKKFNPYTAGRRFMTAQTNEDITATEPERSLLAPLHRKGGRNNLGRITSRHRGGGSGHKYRIVDFKRDKTGVPGRVATIEYDPNRSARIALVNYLDGEKRYILAPSGLKIGDNVQAGADSDIKPGNAMKLRDIPVGTIVHNIELQPGKGGVLSRSAGASAQLMAKEGKYVFIKMPSGELRLILQECMATIGQVGNVEHENVTLGKAGKKRWLGRRPHVRGMVITL